MTNEMSKRKYPQEMLLMNDCPNCGQKVNSQFVENTIDEIVDLAVAEERKRIVEEIKKIHKDEIIELFNSNNRNETKEYIKKGLEIYKEQLLSLINKTQ